MPTGTLQQNWTFGGGPRVPLLCSWDMVSQAYVLVLTSNGTSPHLTLAPVTVKFLAPLRNSHMPVCHGASNSAILLACLSWGTTLQTQSSSNPTPKCSHRRERRFPRRLQHFLLISLARWGIWLHETMWEATVMFIIAQYWEEWLHV